MDLAGADSVPKDATAGLGRRLPLTERILLALPGPKWLWVLVWALVPWLNLAVVVWLGVTDDVRGPQPGDVLNRAAVTAAIVLSLWSAARLSDELQKLRGSAKVLPELSSPTAGKLFRGIDSVIAPLVATVVVALVLPLDELVAGAPLAAVVQGITWLVIGIPLCTAGWAYLVLQFGLGRLDGSGLRYTGDRTLGLDPVGRVAFTGLLMLVGIVLPLLITGVSDLSAVVVSSAVLVAGFVAFFLSLRRLHLRMVQVKRAELARVLELYRQAYEQVQHESSLDVLQQKIGLLTAAETLEKRAERIQRWPFDEATFARVVTIASSVVGVIIARLLLAPTGL
ncbi:hypothetical protein [Salinibacterium sp. ZJ450]|uniref:hypothetical protein n=1 Tax=Salinibacterium sp. ZJ450 TaxID=2708338 RepID=UPI0014241EBC|nr:hypothetical protein [Salinibacterium sp. ZJ450]